MKVLKRRVIALIAVAFAVILLQFNPFWHLVYTVNDWNGWCNQLLERELPGCAIRFDHAGIRRDFATRYNDLVVTSICQLELDGAKRGDKVPKELERLRLIGAWVEGDDLHIANELLPMAKDLGIDGFKEWEASFRQHTSINWLIDAHVHHRITDQEYCEWVTITDHFASAVLIGPDSRTARVPPEVLFQVRVPATLMGWRKSELVQGQSPRRPLLGPLHRIGTLVVSLQGNGGSCL